MPESREPVHFVADAGIEQLGIPAGAQVFWWGSEGRFAFYVERAIEHDLILSAALRGSLQRTSLQSATPDGGSATLQLVR